MKKPALYICIPILISACASVGTQYVQPTSGEKSAELVIEKKEASNLKEFLAKIELVVTNFDDKGCYSGKTEIDDKIRIHAGKPIFIGVEKYDRNKYLCRSFISFVPETNAQYRLASDSVENCNISLDKIADDSRAPVSVNTHSLKTGLGCIRLTPAKQ